MGKGQYYHWKGAQGRGTGGLKRPYEIIILESRGVNIQKRIIGQSLSVHLKFVVMSLV